jgi:hypothetical protein
MKFCFSYTSSLSPKGITTADDGPKTVDIPPGEKQQVTTPSVSTPTSFRMIMPMVVSVVSLAGGLFVILAKRYQSSDRHWAYATVGTIVGYWLKG